MLVQRSAELYVIMLQGFFLYVFYLQVCAYEMKLGSEQFFGLQAWSLTSVVCVDVCD